MVEPFGCVVMLHWRLHVYGGPVPLPATPSGPSPLFYSPLSHALCASLRSPPSLLSPTPFDASPDRRVPPSHPRTVDNPLKRNVIIGPCIIIVLSPFGNYIILTSARPALQLLCFFIFRANTARQYDRRLLKRLHQVRTRRNRESIVGRFSGHIAITSNGFR